MNFTSGQAPRKWSLTCTVQSEKRTAPVWSSRRRRTVIRLRTKSLINPDLYCTSKASDDCNCERQSSHTASMTGRETENDAKTKQMCCKKKSEKLPSLKKTMLRVLKPKLPGRVRRSTKEAKEPQQTHRNADRTSQTESPMENL